MKKIRAVLLATLFSPMLFAQSVGENFVFKQLKKTNFYFLDQLNQDQEVLGVLKTSGLFKNLSEESTPEELNLKPSLPAVINRFIIAETDINRTGDEWKKLVSVNPAIRAFVKRIKASEKYANFNGLSDEEFAKQSWQLCLNGLNYTLRVYGLGEKPRYATIDSVSYDVKTDFYIHSVSLWARALEENRYALFYQKRLDFAVSLLYLNHRDEAVRYEPLLSRHNAKAVLKARASSDHPYSSIIVLGNGPENYTDRLSALGKLNLYLAVQEFSKGKAPFLIVSGGHVHPNRTSTCEALEMKKELMNVYHIPEENIIVEPYARHTTTNLRNAARLMIQYGIDIHRKSLVVTNYGHSLYTGSADFLKRCEEELGYVPGEISSQKAGGILEFLPNRLVGHQNPFEPLDP
jgi:hypothetical protein